MIRKITQVLFVLTILLSLSSCMDTKQKTQAFVNSYNNSAANFSNEIIISTEAKAFHNEKRIEINVETSIEQNENNKSIYGQMFPLFLKEALTTDQNVKDLIEEGVVFDVNFLADDRTSIAEFKIDQKELAALLKKNAGKPTISAESLASSDSDTQLQQILVMMNQNMPFKNNDGSKILKIYVNDKKQLVYQVEMPEDVLEILKNNAANSLVKESILREGQLQKVASTVSRYGIKDIKYEYLNAKGKIVNSMVITEKDLKL
ncbi:hypothetical protein [Flavobacterium sp. LC2016-01]|uniref:hypothetical protein n=1 Tax=Flavobacterium sp. LC2016-01 TaxID=2675876 RepID=UPI0012BAA7A8|nr:hypothetical protein [Flavobacterium sp. LC2016-01]MTH14281.1 hypothetical protein [Flavobacterium sp. LC2016-01]